MLIKTGYHITFETDAATPMSLLLSVHP